MEEEGKFLKGTSHSAAMNTTIPSEVTIITDTSKHS